MYFVSCFNKSNRSQTEMSHVACVYTEANGYKGQMFCAFNCGIIRVTKTHNISLKGLIEKSLLLLLRKTFFCWKWALWTTRGEQNSVLNFKRVPLGTLSNILYTFTIITFLLAICEQTVSWRSKMKPSRLSVVYSIPWLICLSWWTEDFYVKDSGHILSNSL